MGERVVKKVKPKKQFELSRVRRKRGKKKPKLSLDVIPF